MDYAFAAYSQAIVKEEVKITLCSNLNLYYNLWHTITEARGCSEDNSASEARNFNPKDKKSV